MISALKGALSGQLETVILGLMKSTAQYDASEIKASIKVRTTRQRHTSQICLHLVQCVFLKIPEAVH